jgi:class 3 adenylate cyclase
VLCDLAGSTSLAPRLDAEGWRYLVNTYLEEDSAAVTVLGGHILKSLGDGLMALFGYRQAQNDAERAPLHPLAELPPALRWSGCAGGETAHRARVGARAGQARSGRARAADRARKDIPLIRGARSGGALRRRQLVALTAWFLAGGAVLSFRLRWPKLRTSWR